MNCELQKLKRQYIPMFARGEISERAAARKIGIRPVSVWRLKKRYLQCGDAAFVHGNTGRAPKNRRFDRRRIFSWYKENFLGAPFAVVRDCYALEVEPVSYSTVYNALSSAGVVSPRARIPVREKRKHLPRKERPREGELLQIDGSKHNWFIGLPKTCIHGAIDDATHKITALYMCENECLLGYFELLRQTAERFGLPRAIYSDRSSCFFVTSRSLEKVSIAEQLAGVRSKRTQWQEACARLSVELIAALSPEAKGRIERLWETLQGRLPYVFRHLGIDTVAAANEFLKPFVDDFNARFSVPAQNPDPAWRAVPDGYDFDLSMSVRASKRTDSRGVFVYHGCDFRLVAPRAACRDFTLLLNERYGLRGYMGGLYYPVSLESPLVDVYGDSMPVVEKNLIYEYFLADTHCNTAVASSVRPAEPCDGLHCRHGCHTQFKI